MDRGTELPSKVTIGENVMVRALIETFRLVRSGSFGATISSPVVGGGIAVAAGARIAGVVIWSLCCIVVSFGSGVILTVGLHRLPWPNPYVWLRTGRWLLFANGVILAGQFAIVPVYRNGTLNPLWSVTLMLSTALLAAYALLGFGIPGLFSAYAGPIALAAGASCLRVSGLLGPVLAFGCLVFFLVLFGTNRLAGNAFRSSMELRFENEILVEELEAANSLLEVRAHTDLLTGLSNRAGLWSQLERRETLFGESAVLFLDLDGFKPINDEHGHMAGDYVLKIVAERLSAVAREGDIVARMGGDEFVVIAHGMHDDDAHLLARRMNESISTPIDVFGSTVAISASIGVAMHSGDDMLHATLVHADALMYAAKRAQRPVA